MRDGTGAYPIIYIHQAIVYDLAYWVMIFHGACSLSGQQNLILCASFLFEVPLILGNGPYLRAASAKAISAFLLSSLLWIHFSLSGFQRGERVECVLSDALAYPIHSLIL
jgi:hypothetical protein